MEPLFCLSILWETSKFAIPFAAQLTTLHLLKSHPMKKVTFFLLFALSLTACQQSAEKQESASIDKQAIEKEAGSIMDRMYEAQKLNHFSDMNDLMADDGILLGTDPAEVMGKAAVLETLNKYAQDSVFAAMLATLTFDVKKRDFIVADDGSQVIVTDLVQSSFSKLPIRAMAILKKYDGKWMIFYGSNGFLINNEDMAKVDALFQ